MGINSISEQKSNIDFQTNNVQNNNRRYYIKSNGVDKTPQSDTVQISNKKDTVKKVAIGAAIVGTAVGLFYLLRGKKPPKKVMEQAADTIADTKPKMEITEEAKKIYDDVASKFHKKTRVTSETIEQNTKPKEKAGSWSSDDMKEFYTKLEKESDAKIAAEKAAKEAEEKVAKRTIQKIVQTLNGNINVKISTTANGKTHNMYLQNNKNGANLNCYLNSYYDIHKYSPKGYVDKNGNICGLYVNSLVSSGGGMGTEAMKQAVLLSRELGQEGRVYLHAAIIDKAKGTPVPFYTKLGFQPVNKSFVPEIQKGMEDLAKNGKYTGPQDIMMYLPLDKIDELLAR